MTLESLVMSVVPAVAGLIGFLVVRKVWPNTGRWGINREKVDCPRCGKRAPSVRIPANLRQMLWGGWTCQKCGCEFDKYGKEVDTQ